MKKPGRVVRLAVVSADMFIGTIGEISDERLHRIQKTLADWIQSAGGTMSLKKSEVEKRQP